jgi:hypothetical protein
MNRQWTGLYTHTGEADFYPRMVAPPQYRCILVLRPNASVRYSLESLRIARFRSHWDLAVSLHGLGDDTVVA